MSEPAEKKAVYEDLYRVPEGMTGEIVNGELIATPRPSRRHIEAASALGYNIGPAYQFGEGGGPGGWIILIEPEIGFAEDILVPDLAGWRRERYPRRESHNWISVAPDWICEVLSPGTFRQDKIRKMPIYGLHNVHHCWFLDPLAKTLEIFRLESGKWMLIGVYAEDDRVKAEPFQEIEIDLRGLWPEG